MICVPNFSCNDDAALRPALTSVVEGAGGRVLDWHFDADFGRAVMTFVASDERPAVAAAVEAIRLIDLREVSGVHPRLGVADVVPFVPESTESMDQAKAWAAHCGERIFEATGVPVFLYGNGRPTLPEIRRRAFQDLPPDFGGPSPHETAGACVVGARGELVAFNVYLESDIASARRIASAVRSEFVRALGFYLTGRKASVVTCNLIAPQVVTTNIVYEKVEALAGELGVHVIGSEIVGLTPEQVVKKIEAG